MHNKIIIRGARVNNLKNLDIDIPKDKLVVITGLSGSGKSSLAFDTIYAEGQRRYVESLSSFARQFMEVKTKPDADMIEGLSPTIAIDQRTHTHNPRSTVGTVTEIYDYLRLLFARVGRQYCPVCDLAAQSFTIGQIIEKIKKMARTANLAIASPLVRSDVVERRSLLEKVEKSGYDKVAVDGQILKINDLAQHNFVAGRKYDVDLIISLVNDVRRQDIAKITEMAVDLGNGLVKVLAGEKTEIFSLTGLCLNCGRTMPPLDVRNFSFNSPYGACKRCTGLGVTMEIDPNLIIPNQRLTLAEGAIQPWTRIISHRSHNQKLLSAVAGRHGFSLDVPVQDLPSKIMNIILYGTGAESYNINGRQENFDGVIPVLTRKYLETNSDYVHKEIEQYMYEVRCPQCNGQRLKTESLFVKIDGKNISDISALGAEDCLAFVKKLLVKMREKTQDWSIVKPIIKEIATRLENLGKVGLAYLSSDRPMNTLSGGEATRVRLATQLSTGLIGIIYVLDEPSVGLHPRDNQQLIDTLKGLRDLGNTVIVVEHDAAMIKAADYLIDIGPGAGVNGGMVVANGSLARIKKNRDSITGNYLSGRLCIRPAKKRAKNSLAVDKAGEKKGRHLSIIGAKANNLKNIDVKIPLGELVCVTGVSGSGKSTLVIDILGKALTKHFYRAKNEPGEHKAIEGLGNIDKVVAIDQSPIGRTPRSNPATYTTVFAAIRDLFANLPESRMYNYSAGKFSFNVKGGGRCESCCGEGYIRIPMQFLADVYVECPDCDATRYSREVLEVHYHGKNIADVLDMTVDEAYTFFNGNHFIACKLNVLREVGLGYIRLGQSATTLSGGEAQRVKLATELSRAATGRTLYILDEPTTGLHFEDVQRLLCVLSRLVEKGNTVVIIEHNLDVIRCADWVIDLGPGGGRNGGEIVAQGACDQIKKVKGSWTGRYL